MTTKQEHQLEQPARAKANPNWGLGLSLVLVGAIIAAYLISAPRASKPGVLNPVARGNSAAIDPSVRSVQSYLDAHRAADSAEPVAAVDPAVKSVQEYLDAHRADSATGSNPDAQTSLQSLRQRAAVMAGASPYTDMPFDAWGALHYPHGQDWSSEMHSGGQVSTDMPVEAWQSMHYPQALPTEMRNELVSQPSVGQPATDIPTQAWDSMHYPNGLDK